MAKKFTTISTKTESQQSLLDQIEAIKELYAQAYQSTEDPKSLQGMERCVELKIKVITLEQPTTNQQSKEDTTIDITKLPTTLLLQIINHIENTMKPK